MKKWGYGLLAAASLLCAAARAETTPAEAAYDARDIVMLDRLGKSAASSDERNLANGAALALRRKDEAAIAVLTPLSRTAGDADHRAKALLALSEIHLRQGRFADTAAALKQAGAQSPDALDESTRQTLDFAETASAEKPMRVISASTGRLDITRDSAGLIRVPIRVNGKSQDAVIDSGANFSTISESAAKHLGVRLLERTTSIGSASKETLPTRIGVADKLRFGEAELAHVLFIVLPDEALTFGGGQYKIDAIIGLPVFIALGRIEVSRQGDKESLFYGSRPRTEGESNLLLSGVEPLVLVKLGNAEAPLRMFIDTGATTTELNAKAAKDFPELTDKAVKQTANFESAGGKEVDEGAMNIPELTLIIAGRPVTVKNISLYSKQVEDRHGAIGQDVLKQGGRFVLDFDAMRFSLEE